MIVLGILVVAAVVLYARSRRGDAGPSAYDRDDNYGYYGTVGAPGGYEPASLPDDSNDSDGGSDDE